MQAQMASQKDAFEKQVEAQMAAFAAEKEALEAKRRETRRQTNIINQHKHKYRLIKEANSLCKEMGKNIKFSPIMIKQAYSSSSGRRMSISNEDDDDMKNVAWKDDLQIQVND